MSKRYFFTTVINDKRKSETLHKLNTVVKYFDCSVIVRYNTLPACVGRDITQSISTLLFSTILNKYPWNASSLTSLSTKCFNNYSLKEEFNLPLFNINYP